MPDQIAICNQALAEIFSGSISSMDERSVEAIACRNFYEPTLREMLEADHPWSFATKRLQLAAATNLRAAEWGYAYALPDDCARPRRIVPDMSAAVTGRAYYSLSGEWPKRGLPWDDGLGRFYIVEGGVVYSWLPNATLEYTRSIVTAAEMTQLFARAFVLELASRIVAPLKKSRELKGDLIKQAEVAKQRAMATDANRQPQQDEPYEAEVERVRSGGYC